MRKYRKLPPISRSPTPPLDTLRRLRSFGGIPGELVEEDGQDQGDDEISGTPSAPIVGAISSAPSPKKRRKTRKRSLVLGKDTGGNRKRRKLQTEGKEIQKALDSDTLLDSDSDDDGNMLESITVAGGFLIIGQGSLNGAKKKELDEAQEHGGDQKDGNDEISIDAEEKLNGKVKGRGSVESTTRSTPNPAPKTVGSQGARSTSLIKGRPQRLGLDDLPEALDVGGPHAKGVPGDNGEKSSVSCDKFRPPTPTPDVVGRSQSPPIEPGSPPEGLGDRSCGKPGRPEDPAVADHASVEMGGVPLPPVTPGATVDDAALVGTKDNREAPHPVVDDRGNECNTVGGISLVGGAQEDEEVKGLIFDITASPGSAAPQKITGLDFYCPAKHGLSWDRLYGIFRQKFSVDLDSSNLRVLGDREFRLQKQEDLDDCIRDLRLRGVPKHDIQLHCSPDGECEVQDTMAEDIRGLGEQDPKSRKGDDAAKAVGDAVAADKAGSAVSASSALHVPLPPQATNPDGEGEALLPAVPENSSSPSSLEQRDTASEPGAPAVSTPSLKARTPGPTLPPPAPQTDLEHQPKANLKYKAKPKTHHLDTTETPHEPESPPQVLLSDERSAPKPVYVSPLKKAINRYLISYPAASFSISPPANANRWRSSAGDITIPTPGARHSVSPMPGGIGDEKRSRPEQEVRKTADTAPSQLPKGQNTRPTNPSLSKALPSVPTGVSLNTAQAGSMAPTSNMPELLKNQIPNVGSSVAMSAPSAPSLTTTTSTKGITASNSGPTTIVHAENATKLDNDAIKSFKGESQENDFHTGPLGVGDAMDVEPMSPTVKTESGLNPASADVNGGKPQSTDKGKYGLTGEQPSDNLGTGGFPSTTRPPETSRARPMGQGDISGPAEHIPSHVHPMDIDPEAHAAGPPPKAARAADQDSVAPVSTRERDVQGNQYRHTSTAGTAPQKRNRARKGKETKVQPGLKNGSVSGESSEVLEKQKLMVKLKIPLQPATGGTHAGGAKQGPLPKTAVPNHSTPAPQAPTRLVPTPPGAFTPVNAPPQNVQIPRPQPYRNPHTASRPAAAPRQMIPPPAPSMGAPQAARIRAEQTKGPESKGSIGANDIPAPLFSQSLGFGVSLAATQGPRVAGTEAPMSLATLVAQKEIPRPAWKPGPRPGASVTNILTSMGTVGLDPQVDKPTRETPEGAFNIASVGVRPTARNPFSPPNRSYYWYSADGNQNLQVPPPVTPTPTLSTALPIIASIPPLDSKKVTATPPVATGNGSNRPNPIIPATKAASVPVFGIEGPGNSPSHPKKIAPLVSKNNFLYYEPVVGGKDKITGKTIERASSGGGSGKAGPGQLWGTEESVPKATYLPLQSPSPALKQQIKAQDMVLCFTVYEGPTRKTVVHGHEILLNSAEPTLFSWDKLVNTLGERIGFVDFKECLVFNYHYMVENQDELNKGIVEGFYRAKNDVVIAKVDPMGRLPSGLVARMKETRKALRRASAE